MARRFAASPEIGARISRTRPNDIKEHSRSSKTGL
jgi:hypothetical protein